MSLFLCTECGCIENTACCNYWVRKDKAKPICSACDPDIGRWHGRFERRVPDPATVRRNKLGGHYIDIVPNPQPAASAAEPKG
jgi:hypothetical protein